MKTEITAAKWSLDSSGTWLCLKVRNPQDATQICDSLKDGKTYTAELKQKTKKRSLNANNYLWLLCDKLATVNGTTKEEVYRVAIRDVGVFLDFEGITQDKAAELSEAWGKSVSAGLPKTLIICPTANG